MKNLLVVSIVLAQTLEAFAVPMAPSGQVLVPNAAGLRALASAQAPAAKKRKEHDDSLSHWVMKNAIRVSQVIHRTGGYRFDGWNDCYGFVKRTWNPILHSLRYTHHLKGDYPSIMPVGDYPSPAWHAIRSWDDLRPGDVLGTTQGHRGGAHVHYGLYAGRKGGVHYQYDNGGGAGPKFQPDTGRFKYYYGPTHQLLERLHG